MLQWINKVKRFDKKNVAIIIGIMSAIFFLIGPFFVSSAFAQSVADPNSSLQEGVAVIEEPLGLPSGDIRSIIANIIRAALGLLGIVVVGLMIYAGFLWMTAGGNEDQIGKAKKILINATIGLVIILSAYAIVSFIFKMLGVGGVSTGTGINAPGTENFQGSGALGSIIKEHYPARGQTNVPRNTKIVVTFRKPIKIDSVAADTNNNGIYGDCINVGANMKWQTDCDALKMNIISVKRSDNNADITGAAILANFEKDQNGQDRVYTIVIRPYENLGSSTENVTYKVKLGEGVLLDDLANGNPSAFSTKILGNNFYEWQFTCDTKLDVDAPYIISVNPGRDAVEVRNTAIQINFSEPIDPVGMQGKLVVSGEYYNIQNGNIYLKSENSSLPEGNFNLVNGYRTLEFIPTKVCGKNACGGDVYCLPVCDKEGASCKEDAYQILVKAARVFNAQSFEAVPFSGAMDMSSNALDGNNNKKVEQAPVVGAIFVDQAKPDNDFWKFTIKNEMDLVPPFLKEIVPGLDAENIKADEKWTMLFSKKMLISSLYNIGLEEKPTQPIPLCKSPRVNFVENTTLVDMYHCDFLVGRRQYYFPVLDSSLVDAHFNCFFPGKGPNEKAGDDIYSAACQEDGANCCQVINEDTQAFCCNGSVNVNYSTKESCLNYQKNISN